MAPLPEIAARNRLGVPIPVLQVALATLVLVLDALLARGVSVGMLYTVVVVMSLLRGAHAARIAAGYCSLFLFAGWALEGSLETAWMAATNRFLAVTLVWGTAELVRRIQRDDSSLERQKAGRAHDLARLERAEERFRLALDAAPCAMIGVGRDGRIALVNTMAESVFGYGRAEMIGQSVEFLVPERHRLDHVARRETFLEKPVTRPMGSGLELSALRKDGSEFPIEIGLNLISSADAEPLVLAAVMDDSGRKRAEEDLRAMLEAAPTAEFLVDARGQLLMVNSGLEQLFGYDRSELVGQPIEKLVPLETRARHPAIRDEYFRSPRAMMLGRGRDVRARRKDGSEFPVEIGLSPVETRHGSCVIGAVADLTERSLSQQQLVRHSQDLRRINEDLDAFAYVASHDLKAPLRAIANLASWIEEDAGPSLPGGSREHLALLRRRVQRMEKLLNDLLAYSRAGRAEAHLEELDVRTLVEGIVETLAPPAGFTVTVLGDCPPVRAPRAALEQIVRNLVDNAIKHHDKERGRIEVWVLAREDHVEFVVSDDGPGIPPEYHERVFAMFQTLKPRDEVEGSGMGLAIVKKLVERNGGRVRIVPSTGRGASFAFTWPQEVLEGALA